MSRILRLGISGSSFLRVVPAEVAQVLFSTARTGGFQKLDRRQNDLMAGFMRDMIGAMNRPEVSSFEVYHSAVWDRDMVLKAVEEDTSLEHWSVHAPYGRFFDPSSPDPQIRASAISSAVDSIEAAVRIGAKVLVIHPGADVQYAVSRAERLRNAVETLGTIEALARKHGVRLAIEPLPKGEIGNTIEEVIEIVERLNSDDTGVNFDVNHLFPPEEIPDMIVRAGRRIVSVHISDQDGQERHWMPFRGRIDWRETLSALLQAGYTGPLIYETHVEGAQTCSEVVDAIVENYIKLRAAAGI